MLAAFLAWLPPDLADVVRVPAIAVMAPVHRGLIAMREMSRQTFAVLRAQFGSAETAARQEAKTRLLAEENDRLRIELQTACDQLRLLRSSDADESRLLGSQCVPARVLGATAQNYLLRRHLLDVGRSHGIEVEGLVLQTPLLDQGADVGLEDGDLVLAGSRVWGKIVSVGSCTSTVCSMTGPGYRDLVRLASPSPDGRTLRLGAKGILEGTGETLARLRMIETSEPVAEGDLVYSLAGQGFVEMPLLCGRIVRLERPQGAGHWEIWVAPAADETPDDLAVLCATIRRDELARRETPSDAALRKE